MASSVKSLLATAIAASLALALSLPGCGSDKGGGGGPPGIGGAGGTSGDSGLGGGSGSGGTTGSGLCLLNNCHSDQECEGCSYGRTICDVSQTRCIACNASKPCKPGEKCTSFGTCAPEELTCNTDSTGTPTISCSKDADCAACDPMHQVCDTASGKCVACVSGNTASCTGNQTCGTGGKCENKCPTNCTADTDCEKCEAGGVQAKACNNHVCAECSPTKPCVPGMECSGGKCIKPCGTSGGEGADCKQDAECYGCGNTSSTETWKCKFPINGGTHGTCTHPATGCTDLLSAGAVLPPPFDGVTNTCSTDANCAGVSMDVNVGKIIRDLVGGGEVNLGIKKVQIKDSILKFPMKACASIEILDGKKCGVCVPCNDDADCTPIELDPLIGDLFKGDPLMQIAAAFLMDLLFGKDKKHQIHMQCQEVAAGYGVCLPCANPLDGCGAGSGSGTTSGNCGHDKCTVGDALDPKCGVCEAAVCLVDPFCCTKEWDELCVAAVGEFCGTPCAKDPTCAAHTPCETGGAMKDTCSNCTLAVCDVAPSCCDTTNGTWSQTCVDYVLKDVTIKPECGGACGKTPCGAHSECVTGTALSETCTECTKIICAKDKFCCDAQVGKWDLICVDEASKEPMCPPCPKK